MTLSDWQRIEKIIRWAGLSVNSFALHIGLSRGENLYQIKKGNNGISKELTKLITTKYPNISKAWILAGEGDMFLGAQGQSSQIVGYDMDVLYLAALDSFPEPSYVMTLPRATAADFAALLLNKSMEPEMVSGSILLLSAVLMDDMIPGNPYLVVMENNAAVRRVRSEAGGDKLRLVAINPDFDDMVIWRDDVKRLYAVKGHMFHYN